MRAAAVLVALLLSGCVTELLEIPEVTARGIACDAFDADTPVRVIHHGEVPAIDDAMAAWVVDVSRVRDEDGGRFSWLHGGAPGSSLDAWVDDLDVRSRGLSLHVLWLAELEGSVVQVLKPGVVAINATAARGVEQPLLFHGLGHALGVVNLGVPMHDVNGPQRESPAGHTPGGPLSVAWHRQETFPGTTTGYGDATIADWKAAIADGRICP